jgi:RNA polymerase sigma-70 factor (family 1)
MHDPDTCKDIVQDVFIWLWEKRAGLEVRQLPPYLKAAVKYKIANHIRAGNIHGGVFEQLAHIQPIEGAYFAEAPAETRELQAIIQDAIQNMPEKYREVFLLSREERFSNAEIARRLNVSVKTVEARMTVALKQLRTAVGPYLLMMLLMQVAGYN